MINKIMREINKAYICLKYFLKCKCLKGEQLECKRNWIFFSHLKEKYKNKLESLPKYESTGIYSNKVWWCWLQGEENAPELNKACLNSLRKNLVDRDIVVITKENYKDFVDIPEFIITKYKKGIISNTHFSDLLRLELLIKYGGTWIDSSVLCTEYYKAFFDKPLFMFENWKRGDLSVVSSNWFITAEKNEPILKTTIDLLYDYWDNYNYLIHYFIFHFFFTLATSKYEELWKSVNRFSNLPPHILQFELTEKYSEERFKEIEKMSSFHKLNQNLDFSNCKGDTNYDYIINKYMKEEYKCS